MTRRLPPPLETAGPGGVFFLYGDDEFRKERTARSLVDAHLDESTRDFNFDRLRGSEVDLGNLAAVLATPPMMAEWRVVLLRETEALASSSRARSLLTELADSPPPGLALVLVAAIPRGSKAKLYKELKAKAKAVEFEAVSSNDIPGWLMAWTRESHGRELEEDAARALGTAVGSDLGILAQEMEKLVGVAGDEGPITLEHVKAAGTVLPRQDRWQWFDAVGERRFQTALDGLPILLGQGESGVGLTIGLGTHLLRLGVAVERGVGALEEVLPPHQRWLARRYGGQARKWTGGEVEAALAGLLRVDRLLKASAFSDEHLLESWLLGLMVGEREAA